MKTVLLIAALTALAIACAYNPNHQRLVEKDPVLLNSVTNGEKFVIGDLNDSERNYLYVANLKGTPY